MNVLNEHNSEPLTYSDFPATSDHDTLLAELTAYNYEAMAIHAEHAALIPQSQEINKLAGMIEAIRETFEPRLNALTARVAKQATREKDLKARCKRIALQVDFHASGNPLNN